MPATTARYVQIILINTVGRSKDHYAVLPIVYVTWGMNTSENNPL